ncbi:MAG: GxxExxY protein [Verrucomicrobia bacterium]|nr:GxxExxY protein [Verrucomicrobiota bacterium]
MDEDDKNPEKASLQFEQETSMILNCAFEIINGLGHGLLEKPYENSLCVEFTLRGIPWVQQPRYDVIYKSHKVGEYIPDLVVKNLVVVDTKVIDRITDHEIGQMLNYLKITGHPVGLIINFKRARLEWKRVINQYPKS